MIYFNLISIGMGWIEYRLVWAGITNSVLELATPFLSSNFQSFKIAHWAFFFCPRQSPTSRTKDHQLRQHVTANKTLFSQRSFASSSSRKQHHFNGSETNTLLHTLYQSPISSFGCVEFQIHSVYLEPTIAKTFVRSKLELFLRQDR